MTWLDGIYGGWLLALTFVFIQRVGRLEHRNEVADRTAKESTPEMDALKARVAMRFGIPVEDL